MPLKQAKKWPVANQLTTEQGSQHTSVHTNKVSLLNHGHGEVIARLLYYRFKYRIKLV